MSPPTKNEADILSRIIDPTKAEFSPDAARSILALSFNAEDMSRMNDLSQKASAGKLSLEEQEELDSYERVGHLVAILQSKARLSLKEVASEDSSS